MTPAPTTPTTLSTLRTITIKIHSTLPQYTSRFKETKLKIMNQTLHTKGQTIYAKTIVLITDPKTIFILKTTHHTILPHPNYISILNTKNLSPNQTHVALATAVKKAKAKGYTMAAYHEMLQSGRVLVNGTPITTTEEF